MILDEPILRAVNLNKTFFMGQAIYAVNNVSLAVGKGEFVAIVGPSGSGKSTLLSLLGGLDRPISGEIILDGQRYSKLGENGLAMLRRKHLGFVFQFFNLIPHLSALENVALPMRFNGRSRAAVTSRAQELLEMVSLGSRMKHLPLQLSGGEQQRVAIARALANSPSVVLADEPTGNLDTKTREEMSTLFTRLNREQGQTFVVVTHDEGLAAGAQRTVYMRDGQVEKVETA